MRNSWIYGSGKLRVSLPNGRCLPPHITLLTSKSGRHQPTSQGAVPPSGFVRTQPSEAFLASGGVHPIASPIQGMLAALAEALNRSFQRGNG